MSLFHWSPDSAAEWFEETRTYRFQTELRPVYLQHLGMTPGMDVLEVCCGPGTLAPYLAAGISPGTVTGVDLNESFIERARRKAEAAGIAGVRYVVGDAQALAFANESFDAVTSYAGVSVLPDPRSAVAEMVRVCRPGGTVSIVEVVAMDLSGGLEQTTELESYPAAQEYRSLYERFGRLERELLMPRNNIGNRRMPTHAYLGLLGHFGLERLQVNAWGYSHALDDSRMPPERRQQQRRKNHQREVERLRSLPGTPSGDVLEANGFSRSDLERLVSLAEQRFEWLLENHLYDWDAGLSVVLSGRKPLGN